MPNAGAGAQRAAAVPARALMLGTRALGYLSPQRVGADGGMGSSLEFESVYRELKAIAHRELGRGGAPTLTATALVHEAYLKLAGHGLPESRAHLVSLIVRAMRQVLVDEARRRRAGKRGGDALRITLDTDLAAIDEDDEVLALDQAIGELKRAHPRMGEVVELHFWGGIEFGEIAELLGVDRRTVHRDWTAARALIARALAAGRER